MSLFPSPPTASHGLSGTLTALVRATASYLDVRYQLLVIEGRDASGIIFRALALALIAAISLGLAYAGAWIALVLWMAARWWHNNLAPAVLCAALAHAFLTLLLAVIVTRSLRGRHFFQASRREFHEDHKWLTCHRPPQD